MLLEATGRFHICAINRCEYKKLNYMYVCNVKSDKLQLLVMDCKTCI